MSIYETISFMIGFGMFVLVLLAYIDSRNNKQK